MIPLPNSIVSSNGTFQVTPETSIHVSPNAHDAELAANCLQAQLRSIAGVQLAITEQIDSVPCIRFERDENECIQNESYRIRIEPYSCIVTSATRSGFFYAVQTLLQLLESNFIATRALSLPMIEIADTPRFEWRGMHLDVSRHFFSVSEIKRFLEHLARYKFNRFHWHLTDDHGWRIESKRYPLLTEVGAWRIEADGSRYGGYYSQTDIREVVEYADRLCITVVPEIELPGHSRAAIAAYPDLCCTGALQPVPNVWGIFEDVYCAGKESTFEFLTSLIDELMELFPGQYIHIGGDECPKSKWRECPHCNARLSAEGLHSLEELQSYFVRRIAKHTSMRGKQVIGWDEILEGGLAENAIVMSWRGTEGGIAAVNSGHCAIMSPTSHCYFDYYQGPRDTEPEAFPNDLYLDQVYTFDPVPMNFTDEQQKMILGGQGNVWTERMPNWKHIEYMLFPRMAAMAEVLWTNPDRRNYDDFLSRLQQELPVWKRRNINFRNL